MTINKAQGQTLEFLGIFLPAPCFGHGQLYVALSRCGVPPGDRVAKEANEGDSSTASTETTTTAPANPRPPRDSGGASPVEGQTLASCTACGVGARVLVMDVKGIQGRFEGLEGVFTSNVVYREVL